MRIDIEDELSYTEGIKDNLNNALKEYITARDYLEKFERKIRKHGFPELIKQSNTQKMQLQFEHHVAQDENNWKTWTELNNKKNSAEVKLEHAKNDWQYAIERLRFISNVKEDEVE